MKHLTHYYFDRSHPFRSISALPEDEALSVMKPLARDDLFGMRFKNSEQYLNLYFSQRIMLCLLNNYMIKVKLLYQLPVCSILRKGYCWNTSTLSYITIGLCEDQVNDRKNTESWLRSSFIAKGKKPADKHPLYLIVGDSGWIEEKNIFKMKISVPVDILSDNDVSFTFPDGMYSLMFWKEKSKEFNENIHGIVFTLSEMNELLNGVLKPGDNFPERKEDVISPYIEAQVWNRKLVFDYLKDNGNPVCLKH